MHSSRQDSGPKIRCKGLDYIVVWQLRHQEGGPACIRQFSKAVTNEAFGTAVVPHVLNMASSTDDDEIKTPFSEGHPKLASLKVV